MRSLLARYEQLKARLTQHLGSADLASDALHETWLRLERRTDLAPVENPYAYIYRAALNTAVSMRRADLRRLSAVDVEALLGIADPAPGPAHIAEHREQLAALLAALSELPLRQQIIFRESYLGDTPHRELAARFGVTIRTVQTDLKRAVKHCVRRLGKRNRFVPGDGRTSRKGEEPTT